MVEARQLYRQVKSRLEEAGLPDAAFEAGLLLEKATGLSRFDSDTVSESAAQGMESLVRRRLAREPLQYILGEWELMGIPLAVGPGVLVPRPETEEVCLAAIEALRAGGKPSPVVLDLCAGTGALALGVQKACPAARVTAVEYSPDAFAYCEKNCVAYAKAGHGNVPKPVLADALAYHEALAAESVDLLVSNPPYVTAGEYETLAPELFHEPRQALVAAEDGLLFYRRIASGYYPALRTGGALVFEIGSAQGEAVKGILEENGYRDILVEKDLNGNERIALAHK